MPKKHLALACAVCWLFVTKAHAETAPQAAPQVAAPQPAQAPAAAPAAGMPTLGEAQTAPPAVLRDESTLDLESEEAYVDRWEALKSKQYVHRVVLSAAVRSSSKVTGGRPYLNHIMGFTNIWQGGDNYAKFVSGVQGLSVGYVTRGGHTLELGVEFAAVSNFFLGYRYYYRNPYLSLWPFMGVGFGQEIASLGLKDGPAEAARYTGGQTMGYFTLGILIPLVDVGLRAEVRAGFYGMDRLTLTQGIGASIFF